MKDALSRYSLTEMSLLLLRQCCKLVHNEDDLHLTRFTFDEVQVVSLENDSIDIVSMSFDLYSSTLVLSMMRGMSYLPGMGLGRRQ